jgi:hypothetical protein
VNSLMKKSVLIYNDFLLMYTSDTRSKTITQILLSLTSLNKRTGSGNLSVALQHAITLIYSLLTPKEKR